MDSPWDSSTTPTITLGALKTRIAEVEEEINAGDGSEEYKACIRYKYIVENDIRKRAVKTGSVTGSVDWTMDSGLPAGSIVNVQGFPSGYPPDKTGKHWLDGPNVDLFSVETFDFTPYDGTGDGVEDRLGYRVRIATARPLPAGNTGLSEPFDSRAPDLRGAFRSGENRERDCCTRNRPRGQGA